MNLPEPEHLSGMSDEDFRILMAGVADIAFEDRKRNQILDYQPVSAKVQSFHES